MIVLELFLRDMHRALSIPSTNIPPKLTHYSSILHNVILALATTFSKEWKRSKGRRSSENKGVHTYNAG